MRRLRRMWVVAGGGAFAAFLLLCAPPQAFTPTTVTIPSGALGVEAAEQLSEAGVVANPLLLRAALRLFEGGEGVQAGTYRFSRPEGVLSVARRLHAGDYDLPPVRVTFTEGMTARDMGEVAESAFPHIRAEAFVEEAAPYEGYLFPDTYFFGASASSTQIVRVARENFDAKVAPLQADIAASGRTLEEIVVMASLIEKEARTYPNKELVSGVLWNRIEEGMPLQVDAVFGYIFERDTYSPSYADLEVDSPYNTYKYRGLPPGPIANPGLDSIRAALFPKENDYLYYLTGDDGVMYYARTYAEHQQNERLHL